NSRIASQFARYKADRFAILLVPGLNPAPAKSFSHHLKVVGYLFALYIPNFKKCSINHHCKIPRALVIDHGKNTIVPTLL
ncbi:MAG: hypothetical protein K5655_02410, partial [Lachnospiraceae bacterium]|nr:hypothetical protein [Lachnospiraceae bacterium]